MKKHKKYEFVEKIINKLPIMKNCNIKVHLSEYVKEFKPRDDSGFNFGGHNINTSFLEYLVGLIDGACLCYEELEKRRKKK